MSLRNLFTRLKPNQCKACTGTTDKLSSRGLCKNCEWAINHAPEYDQRVARLDEEIAVRDVALKQLAQDLEAMKLSRRIVVEDNVVTRATLAKAYRKIKQLESVGDKT